jgi:hypothetical protein
VYQAVVQAVGPYKSAKKYVCSHKIRVIKMTKRSKSLPKAATISAELNK